MALPPPGDNLHNKIYSPGQFDNHGRMVLKRVPTSGESKPHKTLVAAYIFGELVPQWEKMFAAKNAGYGEYEGELGPLGEAVEIWRKAKKLKRAFINGVDTSEWDESPREVVMDMIGHLFLLAFVIDEGLELSDEGEEPDDIG